MKICVLAPSPCPFMLGGAEKFLLGLTRAINRYTSHEAELLKIPVRDRDFWGLIEGYERFSRLDLSYFDMVITTKYPAWMVHHRNHHVYMQHKCRGLYDLYHLSDASEELPSHPSLDRLYSILSQEPQSELLDPLFSELLRLRDKVPEHVFSFPGPLSRKIIMFLDDIGLSPEKIASFSAISRNVKERKDYFPTGVDVKVIHHPPDMEGFYCSSYSYVFTASRMEDLKRIHVLIEAYKKVKSDVQFIIAGTGGQEERYRRLASSDPRIKMVGFVSDRELLSHYANSIFVPFIPYDEDYGLITLEAMLSEKPVLTTHDSGGPNELVTHNETGLIVSSDIGELKEAMDYLIRNREMATSMGKKAKEAVSHITWQNTVKALFEERKAPYVKRKRRPKLVVTTTFSVYPPIHGGQKRIFNLWKHLASEFQITFLNIGHEEKTQKISDNLREIVIARPYTIRKREEYLERLLQHPAGDISLIHGYKEIPSYLDLLSLEVKDACLVVLSHPYLYYAVREVYGGPIIYDAHNCEYDMKDSVLKGEKREEYLNLVKAVEGDCTKDAIFVTVVSKEDRERLRLLYRVDEGKILVVENGMDFSVSSRLTGAEKEAMKKKIGIYGIPSGVFVGSYHGPNIEALRQIEKICDSLPNVLFLVAGTVCRAQSRKTPANLKLLGLLSENEKNLLLSICDFALNPVLSGSGSNLKLLEYIAFFLPVVTTKHGIRGYKFTDEHLFISEIEHFPEMIQKMLDFPELDEMIDRVYVHAKALYDWRVLGERLLTTVKDFVKKI